MNNIQNESLQLEAFLLEADKNSDFLQYFKEILQSHIYEEMNPKDVKNYIIKLFNEKLRGKCPPDKVDNYDGQIGHWLEEQMGIKPNAVNAPDLLGYEMKNHTNGKTTFGDWSPDTAIFKKNKDSLLYLNKSEFTSIFGQSNPEKNGRHSWSGKPCPQINGFNDFGQILVITKNQDIEARYSYSKDTRVNKSTIVPKALQLEDLVICTWKKESLQEKVEKKFNQKGFFKCIIKNGVYSEIAFAPPINYKMWIKGVKNGDIYFDSGMYETNPRNYALWRSDNKFWESMITERY